MTIPGELERGNYRATFEDIGEGYKGDYTGADDDMPLLRFYVQEMVDGEWQDMDAGSYCTLMPVGTDEAILQLALSDILDAIPRGRHELERLSWMEPHWYRGAARA